MASVNNTFKADGGLFSKAYSKIQTAKTYINKCRELISRVSFDSNANFNNVKNNLNNSGINSLIKKIEDTKLSLMKIDTEFAERYMSAVRESLNYNTIDVDKLSEEERELYNIEMAATQAEFNRNCLYMLEKYEGSEMMTEEMQHELNYFRASVNQYDIQEKMIGLDLASEEYIDLFKQNAEYTRDIINYNPFLSEEEKVQKLEEFEEEYSSNLDKLNLQRELNDLYSLKEENSDFWNPFVETEINEAIIAKKIELDTATDEEIEYLRMSGWDKSLENTKTFIASAVTGLMSVGESLVDGTVMLTAGTVGFFSSDVAEWTSDFVGYNYSEGFYNDIMVETLCINSVSAYSGWHTVGTMVSSVVGYAALSMLPGGAITTAVSGGLAATGSSSQNAMINGATYGEAYLTGAISGVIGSASGYGVDKIGKLASGSTSISQIAGYTAMGVGVSIMEPLVNTATEYALYANENKNYDNIWDYYVNNGGLLNTVIAAGAGGFSIGVQSLAGYKGYKGQQKVLKEAFDAKTNMYKNYSIESMYENMIQAGYFTREDVPLDKLKNMFKGSTTIEVDGVTLTITNEDAIKRTMGSIMERGITGGGYSSSQLYDIYNLPYHNPNTPNYQSMYPKRVPEPGSLPLLESRLWYLEAEKSILGRLDDFKAQYLDSYDVEPSLRDCAQYCFNERNNLRRLSRDMMSDDVMRAYLNKTKVHFDFDIFVEIKRAKIAATKNIPVRLVTDDMVYESIINSSTSSGDILNKLLGIGGNTNGK